MKTLKQDVFVRVESKNIHGSSVARVASQYMYVHQNASIENVADSFNRHPEVMAVGVVDNKRCLVGLVERSSLFNRLGKQFGRDLLGRKTVPEVMREPEFFYYEKNVFSVAEKISLQPDGRQRIEYFGLVDESACFVGLFSSMDIFTYLASLTQQDILLAGKLQERMQHRDEVLRGESSVSLAVSKYAKGMGGDFHHLEQLENGKIFIALCDVSGKGVSASILTSMLWGILRVYDISRGLVNLVKDINRAVIGSFHLEKYLTGIFALYDETTHELLLADMGHGHLGISRGKKFREIQLPQTNLPIGIDLELSPQLSRIRLQKKDTVVIITDGLVEQQNRDGHEQTFEQWFRGLETADIQEFCSSLIDRFDEYRRGVSQQDDVSVLLLRAEG